MNFFVMIAVASSLTIGVPQDADLDRARLGVLEADAGGAAGA